MKRKIEGCIPDTILGEQIAFRPDYLKEFNDIRAAILMSQIHDWFLPSKADGLSRLKVEKDGFLWLVKTAGEFRQETCLTAGQIDRAIQKLVDLGYLLVKVYVHDVGPRRHIRALHLEGIPLKKRALAVGIPAKDAHLKSNI